MILHDDVIGRPEGIVVTTQLGGRLLRDLPEAWQATPAAKAALRAGGIVFAHCPNVSQVQRFFDCLRELRGFGMLEAFELLQRGWTVRGRSMRPSHRMVAHTGFLCFARRLAQDDLFEPEGEGFRYRSGA